MLHHCFQFWDWDCKPLSHRNIQLFVKAVSHNAAYFPKVKATLTINDLRNLSNACKKIKHGTVYKAAFLLVFYTFLRISNVVPTSAKTFDPTCHILRSDLIFAYPGVHLILKGGKAMQSAASHHVVQIPSLPSSAICPVAVLKLFLSYTSPNSPLALHPHSINAFCYPYMSTVVIETKPGPLWVPLFPTLWCVLGSR